MARRKKVTEPKTSVEEVVVKPEAKTEPSNIVKKLIANPLRLSMTIVLSDFKPFPLTEAMLADEMFMMKIEQLITLNKLERV